MEMKKSGWVESGIRIRNNRLGDCLVGVLGGGAARKTLGLAQ